MRSPRPALASARLWQGPADAGFRLRSPLAGLKHRRAGDGAARRLVAQFCSVEGAFTWFLFAGWYKDFWELRWFPVDFTLFFFAVTIALLAVAAATGRIKSFSLGAPALLMILFAALAVASLSWSSLEFANFDKARRFLLLTSTSFFIGHLIAENPERRQRFGRMLVWFSCAFLLYYAYCRYVIGLSMEAGGDMGPDNYLEYGSDARTVAILCLTIAALGPPNRFYLALPVAAVAMYFLLIMGGRGPLIEAVIGVALLVVALRWQGARALRRLAFYAGLLSAAAAAILFLLAQSGGADTDGGGSFRTLQRFEWQLNGQDTSSLDERDQGRATALQMWLDEPVFGQGIGEFRVKDAYLEYPHNLPLEILSEMGFVGAALFLAVLAVAVRECVRIGKGRGCGWTELAIALIFLSDLSSHITVQGYLADDRVFFALMGFIIGLRPALPRPIPFGRLRSMHRPRKRVVG